MNYNQSKSNSIASSSPISKETELLQAITVHTFIIVATFICPLLFSVFGADSAPRRESSTKDSSNVHSQQSSTMSIPEPSSSSAHDAAGASLSQNNVSQVPRANQNSVNRFARAPAADGPYFAGARMQERSTHMNCLSNQVNAMDDILKSK